jgi:hypothetical protein
MQPSIRRLYLYAAIGLAVLAAIVTANGVSEEVLRLYSFVMALLVAVWLSTDPDIPRDQRPSFDHGMLHWALFPFLAAH